MSSTLEELADERRALARAVSALRLIPVMFESGARPYPPRRVWRPYLAQSDIVVGLYWARYGWVAPEMAVSGLEDEFDLSGALPRLLYIRTPAPEGDPRLERLIARIAQEASTSARRTASRCCAPATSSRSTAATTAWPSSTPAPAAAPATRRT